jgi:N,N'-diacetyllegionaminate synthase
MGVEVVAEIAQGYEGNPELAGRLTQAAVDSGADAVKFQLVYVDELAAPGYKYYELFRSLEMPEAVWEGLAKKIKSAGLRFYLDVFGLRSLDQALALGADGVKIHASDLFNTELIQASLEKSPFMFLALGGLSAEELRERLETFRITPQSPVCLLYGFQAEPTPVEANNLFRLNTLREQFPGYRFGFMDHTEGGFDEAVTLPLMALSTGIVCLEKHITLDRALKIEDYVSALSPERFQEFVRLIRKHEPALGSADFEPTELERQYRQKMQKVVVANSTLKSGDVVKAGAVSLKRIADLTQPSLLYSVESVVGRKLSVSVESNEPILQEMLG